MIIFLNFLAFIHFGMQAGATVTRTLGNNVVRRQLKPIVEEPKIYDWKNIGGTAEAGTINYRESNFRVALSSDGSTVAVGSPLVNESRGQVRVSRLKNASSDEWVPMGLDITGDEKYSFAGTSLSLSKDGTVLAVGFPAYLDAFPQIGYNIDSCARVYKWNQTLDDWEQLGSNVFDIRIFPYPEEDLTRFMTTQAGWSVSLSDDGMSLAVGAPLISITGQVRVYHFDDNDPATGWVEIGKPISEISMYESVGFSVSLSGDAMTLAIGDPNAGRWLNNTTTSSGNTRIFKWNETQDDWGALGNIIVGGQQTGYSVSLSTDGNTLAVGHPCCFDRGIVRVYHINENSSHWDQIGSDILSSSILPDPDPNYWKNGFGDGRSVFLSGDGQTVAVAAPSMSINDVSFGLVRVFRLTNTTNGSVIMMDWDQLGKTIAGERRRGDSYDGTGLVSLSSDGNRLVVGAPIHGNTDTAYSVSDIVNWTGHVRILDLIEVLPTVAPTASSSPSISSADFDSSASPSSPDSSAAFSKRRSIFTLVLIVTLAFVL